MHQPSRHNHDIRVLCSHILGPTPSAPARSCNSPALRGESFCYYHHPGYQRVPSRSQRRAQIRAQIRTRRAAHQRARQSFTVPIPTNRDELLHSLSEILTRIAANQIDLNRAGQLLAALDAAAKNLPLAPASEVS